MTIAIHCGAAKRRLEHLAQTLGACTSIDSTEAPAAPCTCKATGDGPLLSVGRTGLIYRGSDADAASLYSGFPSLVRFDDQHLICAFTVGPSKDSTEKLCWISRSRDGGHSWSLENTILSKVQQLPSCPTDVRISLSRDGNTVFGLGNRLYKHPEDKSPDGKMVNAGGGRHDMGYVDCTNLFVTSLDQGKTFSDPVEIEPAVVGPSFELCCPIFELPDESLCAPVSTWPSWNGDKEGDDRWLTVSLISNDGGKTWPEYVQMFSGEVRQQDGTSVNADELIFWENKLIEIDGGRLLDTAWTVRQDDGSDLPISFTISNDGGKTWEAPRSTGLIGQTCTPIHLGNGQLLCVYRRKDEKGLWAVLASISDNGSWSTVEQVAVWGADSLGPEQTATGQQRTGDMSDVFEVLSFGLPTLQRMSDGRVLMAFWCEEDGINNIRYYEIHVN